MTEKNMLIVLIVAILLGGGFWYFTRSEPTGVDDVNNPQAQNTINTPTPIFSEEAQKRIERGDESIAPPEVPGEDGLMSGLYDTYNASMLERTKFGGVFLFFRDELSLNAQSLDAELKTRKTEIPRGVTILDIIYNNAPELQEKYGVKAPNTIVKVDENGDKIVSWVAGASFDTLLVDIKSK